MVNGFGSIFRFRGDRKGEGVMGYIGPAVHYKRHELDYYRNGKLLARYVRELEEGECACGIDKDPMMFTDGSRVYRKV